MDEKYKSIILAAFFFSFGINIACSTTDDIDLGQMQVTAFLDKCFKGGYPQASIEVFKKKSSRYKVIISATDNEGYVLAAESKVKLSHEVTLKRELFYNLINKWKSSKDDTSTSKKNLMHIMLGHKPGKIEFTGKDFTIHE